MQYTVDMGNLATPEELSSLLGNTAEMVVSICVPAALWDMRPCDLGRTDLSRSLFSSLGSSASMQSPAALTDMRLHHPMAGGSKWQHT